MSFASFESRPELAGGPLVCAFRGWNDGGEAASTAATYLRDRWGAQRFARVDPEEFYDFQVSRPMVRLEGGITRHIEWPANEFFHATLGERPVGLFIGVEPNNKWRTFVDCVVGTAQEVGAGSMITMGAFLADVPHTAPPPVAGTTADLDLAARLGVAPSRYEGPTGITGVLHQAATEAGLESLSLWAAVPHYLPAGTNPKAALALVQKLTAFLNVSVETETLARAAATWEAQVATMVEQNEELRTYVKQLEEGADDRPDIDIPTGDALAAELEEFLRDHRKEGDT